MEGITNAEMWHQCAYKRCRCQILCTQEYCSDYCADADDADEDELQCDCKHPPCALN